MATEGKEGKHKHEPVQWHLAYYAILWKGKTGKKNQTKTYFGGLKAYLRATDHTSSNIIRREIVSNK
jgi:hypothetical protein